MNASVYEDAIIANTNAIRPSAAACEEDISAVVRRRW